MHNLNLDVPPLHRYVDLQPRPYTGSGRKLQSFCIPTSGAAEKVQRMDATCPSEPHNEEASPTDLVPGPPTSLTVVGRANNRIKIEWKEPCINPSAVKEYQIETRTRNTEWEPVEPHRSPDRLSVVVTGLRSNKTYWFRVLAINDRGTKGNSCEEIQSETKFGSKTCKTLTVLAFAGGALGGLVVTPLVAPVLIPVGAAVGARWLYLGLKAEDKKTAGLGSGLLVASTVGFPVGIPILGGLLAGFIIHDKIACSRIPKNNSY